MCLRWRELRLRLNFYCEKKPHIESPQTTKLNSLIRLPIHPSCTKATFQFRFDVGFKGSNS